MRTHYEVLGISPQANNALIQRAYRRAIRAAHPDRHPHDPDRATQMAQSVNLARDVLLDPSKRWAYDQSLRPISATPPPAARTTTAPVYRPPARPAPELHIEPPTYTPLEEPLTVQERLGVYGGSVMLGLVLAWAWMTLVQQALARMHPPMTPEWGHLEAHLVGGWGIALMGGLLGVAWAAWAHHRWMWGPPAPMGRLRPWVLPVLWTCLAFLPTFTTLDLSQETVLRSQRSLLGPEPLLHLNAFELHLQWMVQGIWLAFLWALLSWGLEQPMALWAQRRWRQRWAAHEPPAGSEGVARAAYGASLVLAMGLMAFLPGPWVLNVVLFPWEHLPH